MGKMEIPYVEKDGVLYPLLTVPADIELSAVGKYGLLWLSYMKENHKGRFRTLTRLGCVNRTAHKVALAKFASQPWSLFFTAATAKPKRLREF